MCTADRVHRLEDRVVPVSETAYLTDGNAYIFACFRMLREGEHNKLTHVNRTQVMPLSETGMQRKHLCLHVIDDCGEFHRPREVRKGGEADC
jgi:hypothetical protein